MAKYEAEFTLEGGAEIEADSEEEAMKLALKEAERQYGHTVAREMMIDVIQIDD